MSDLSPTHSETCNLRHYHDTGDAAWLNRWDMQGEDCERCRGLWRLLDEAHERLQAQR